MCSELIRIPITWDGVPLFGVGVVLAIWLAIGAWGLWATAKVAGWAAALKSHLPTLIVVAAFVAIFVPQYFPDGVPIRGYGLMVLAGSVAGIALSMHRGRQAGLAVDDMMGLAVAMFISGIIGARLFYVIEYWDRRIRQADWLATLKAILSFTEGGLVIYGAFIGAMIGFAWYVTRRKIPALAMADLIAPGMIVGLALGRIGCLLNGCCYGGESSAPWAVTFPKESAPATSHIPATPSPPYADQAAAGRFYGFRLADRAGKKGPIIAQVDADSPAAAAGVQVDDAVSAINGKKVSDVEGGQFEILAAFRDGKPLEIRTADGATRSIAAVEPPPRSLPVHPTQIYSAIDAGLLAWVLWSYYPFRRRDGEVTALMITLHPISRYLLEIIRVDEAAVFNTGLSISQNLSVLLVLFAAGMWYWLRKQPAGRLAFSLAGAESA